MRRSQLIAIGAAALLGILGSVVMLWNAVDVTSISRASARQQFEDVRADFRSAPPLVRRDESGRFVRTESSGRTTGSGGDALLAWTR